MRKSLLVVSLFAICGIVLSIASNQVSAAAFTEFTVRPSRVEQSIAGVNFLVKANALTVATEDAVQLTFQTGYTLGVAATFTVSTTALTSWDAECTTAWPGIATSTNVTGQVVTFPSSDLTVATTYCFIVTAGTTNPATPGNYSIKVATRATSTDVDTNTMVLPTVDDDEVIITAAVAPFVRCDVTTTNGSDNAINLGTLQYGTVTSSSTLSVPDNIRVDGGTNAGEGMSFFYRSNTPENGLYSTLGTHLLDGPTAESTLSPTTLDCTGATPCFGIYYGGTTTTTTGTITIDPDFTGLTAATGAGPLNTSIFGEAIATSPTLVSNAQVTYFVNATASEQAPATTDYTETLIFTCKADV